MRHPQVVRGPKERWVGALWVCFCPSCKLKCCLWKSLHKPEEVLASALAAHALAAHAPAPGSPGPALSLPIRGEQPRLLQPLAGRKEPSELGLGGASGWVPLRSTGSRATPFLELTGEKRPRRS